MGAMDSMKRNRDDDRNACTENVEHSPLEISSSPSSKSIPVFKDVISSSVMDGSRGFALVAVVAVCTCMTVISILLILHYETPPSGETSSHMFSSQAAQKDQCTQDSIPHWAALIHKQIQVIQNLVHASLLGGAGFVAAYRGDAVWLFFARNCCFFFGLAALSYLAVDVAKGRYVTFTTSFLLSVLMSTFCVAAFASLELVRQEVAEHVVRYTRGHESNYPPNLPSTRCQLFHTTLIARMADCLQIVAILYTVLTTLATIVEEECASTTSVSLLEMSYREGAHQAFLLSLLFLVTTYPGDQSCVGGAVLCSAWRLTLALSYLCSNSSFSFTLRDSISLVATIVEISLMLPVFIASLLLSRENSQSSQGGPSSSNVKYTRLGEAPDDDEDNENENRFESRSDIPDDFVRRIQSLSMRQISRSIHYSCRQQRGAFIIWLSSASLLAGMTMECILLVGISSNKFEVYQWGMHVATMYLFCTHMSVNSVEVYRRSRYLLALACPVGSIIALWQLWQLFSTTFYFDYWTSSAAILFGWRALCGVGQTIGLGLLQTTEPRSVSAFDPAPSNELAEMLSKARFVLYTAYIPALFLVVVAQAFFTSCSEPLISPSTPECAESVFLLAKYWPGLGTFFHFGGLLVIFSADALAGAGYPPSLAISSVFAAHITILLAGDLLFDVFAAFPLDIVGKVQVFLKVMWMLGVGWLWILLHRLWKFRIAED